MEPDRLFYGERHANCGKKMQQEQTVLERSARLILDPGWDDQGRQHFHLTICMGLDELTNSIRQQDPNIYSDTEARCLVQDDISNTGYNGDCILRYECHYAGNEKMV